MQALQTGAGIARLTGAIITPVAVILAGSAALVWRGRPAHPSADDLIAVLTIAALAVVLAGVGLPLLVGGARRLARLRRVARHGAACPAVITAITGLSDDPDERSVSRIDLTAQVPGRGAVAIRVRQVVPLPLVKLVGPGVRLTARVDPADPTVAVIDWRYTEPRRSVAGSALIDVAVGLLS